MFGVADEKYISVLLEAIDRLLEVSVVQFGKTDLNKGRDIQEAYGLHSALIGAVESMPPEGCVRTVYVQLENDAVSDLKYEYSAKPVPAKEIGFIIGSDSTGKLSKSYFYVL